MILYADHPRISYEKLDLCLRFWQTTFESTYSAPSPLRTLDLCLPLPWGLVVFWSIFSRKQHESCWEPWSYTRVALLNLIRSLHWGLLLTWPLLWPYRPNKMRTCGRPTKRWDAGWARSIRRTLRCWGSLVQKITALRFLFTGWLELQAGDAHKRKRIVVKPSLV